MASGSFTEYEVKSYDFEPLADSVVTEDPADNLSESSEESDGESDGRGRKAAKGIPTGKLSFRTVISVYYLCQTF